MDWYLMPWRRFAEFDGRSRRKEYWTFVLINLLIFVLLFVSGEILCVENKPGEPLYLVGGGLVVIYVLYALAAFIPGLSCTVRRLHDISKSGWWVLIAFVPLVGGVILIVLTATDSRPGPNQYGPNPKFPEQSVEVQPVAEPVPIGPELSQWQRVANTFMAPSKTFVDIQRGNRSWWLPLIIFMVISYALFGAIVQRIGMQQAVQNQIRLNSNTQQQLAQLTPEQRARSEKIAANLMEGAFLASPVLTIATIALLSLGLLGTINFGFGGRADYGSVIAVWFYAWLPGVIKTLLGIAVIYAGLAPESFNIKNFAPTNVGAFLDPADTSKALYALASSLDVVTIWMLVLLGMGVAAVAGVKRRSGYLAVFGWWAIFVLIRVVWAAFI